MKRVLIICAGLEFGGVERFSANIIKYAPKNEFAFDYLIFDGMGDAFAPEIIEKGGRIISIPSPRDGYQAYIKRFGKILDENHYDVVHSHTQFNTGINLWIAKKHGVTIRIAHSHTTAHENPVSRSRAIYENIMRVAIRRNATDFCACGMQAGEWMFQKHPFTVINNGVDTKSFAFSEENRAKIRSKNGIAADEFVIGHSGTLSPLKNQEMLIRILPSVLQKKPDAKLVLLGTCPGNFKDRLASIAENCGVSAHVMFAGAVMNVNEYLSAFDVFTFPSLREGTPIALLEAQANGLPCIVSDSIPKDALITDLCHALPITDEDVWIEALCSAKRESNRTYQEQFDRSGYNAELAYMKLYDIYRGQKHEN